MSEKHYKEKFSAFLNHELPNDERQTIADHLLHCDTCRAEHDEIKFGAALAGNLKRADAPANLWNGIKDALNEPKPSQTSPIPQFSFFNSRGSLAAAILLIGFGLITVVYFGLSETEPKETAKNEPTFNQAANTETPHIVLTSDENSTNQNTAAQILPAADSNIQAQPANANSNNQIPPKTNAIEPTKKPTETVITQNNSPAWTVETLAGMPKTGNRAISENGKLAVGQTLETDANSRARVQVANIGQVEVAPNSRVQLVNTNRSEHRLSLERGVLQAKIFAPPRLFVVDTPSAVAVDLGCEYTLEVDADGGSKLHVTAGYVALTRGGRESIVPAGAMCFTKRGKGLGTPFSDEASAQLQNALFNFDFQNGGGASVQTIIEESNVYDALTLWHLLSRTPKAEREKVFDKLVSFVKLPAGATKEGILRLDKKMLDAWWMEIENVWFE